MRKTSGEKEEPRRGRAAFAEKEPASENSSVSTELSSGEGGKCARVHLDSDSYHHKRTHHRDYRERREYRPKRKKQSC